MGFIATEVAPGRRHHSNAIEEEEEEEEEQQQQEEEKGRELLSPHQYQHQYRYPVSLPALSSSSNNNTNNNYNNKKICYKDANINKKVKHLKRPIPATSGRRGLLKAHYNNSYYCYSVSFSFNMIFFFFFKKKVTAVFSNMRVADP